MYVGLCKDVKFISGFCMDMLDTYQASMFYQAILVLQVYPMVYRIIYGYPGSHSRRHGRSEAL